MLQVLVTQEHNNLVKFQHRKETFIPVRKVVVIYLTVLYHHTITA